MGGLTFPRPPVTVEVVGRLTADNLKQFDDQQRKDSAQDAYINSEFARFDQGLEVKVYTKAGEHFGIGVPGEYSWSQPGSGALPSTNSPDERSGADASETVAAVRNPSVGRVKKIPGIDVDEEYVYHYTNINPEAPEPNPDDVNWPTPDTPPPTARMNRSPLRLVFVTTDFEPFTPEELIPSVTLDNNKGKQ